MKLVLMGIFLALEGPKGAGKTTVASAFRDRLAGTAGDGVVVTKEPTPVFDLGQESHLLGPDLARAIARDRAAHVSEVISPALAAGRSVVCDRYVLSSMVFHSTDGVPPDEIWHLNRECPLPDANLVLTASAGVITARRGLRASPTRLEMASDPAAELGKYLHFGREMENRGVPLKILANETSAQLERAIEWIMHFIRDGIFQ